MMTGGIGMRSKVEVELVLSALTVAVLRPDIFATRVSTSDCVKLVLYAREMWVVRAYSGASRFCSESQSFSWCARQIPSSPTFRVCRMEYNQGVEVLLCRVSPGLVEWNK